MWGIKVGAIVGTGFPTLKIIDVANPSKNDIKNGQWIDGKPVAQEYSGEGDGSVLIQSALIPNGQNISINESHSGIIASSVGVSTIRQFLGLPGIEDPTYSDPTSALVIVGYPGNFWVRDSKGNVSQSEDGIISIFNPTSGDYELQLVPQLNSTTVIVEQLLPNNKTFYKEYNFKGITPRTVQIKFDLKHPSNDILKDKTDYAHPHFPDWGKYFCKFWDLWHKKF